MKNSLVLFKVIWNAVVDVDKLVLTYFSKDYEENFPGNVKAKVTYSLTDENEVVIDMHATTDKPTIVSMTNHSYFNLGGHVSIGFIRLCKKIGKFSETI